MEFLDIRDGLMVASRSVVAIEAIDSFSTAVHVQFGFETKVYQKNIPFSVLRDILNSREKEKGHQIDSTVSRSLEQLARFQTVQVP
jgi:hypothetical protein